MQTTLFSALFRLNSTKNCRCFIFIDLEIRIRGRILGLIPSTPRDFSQQSRQLPLPCSVPDLSHLWLWPPWICPAVASASADAMLDRAGKARDHRHLCQIRPIFISPHHGTNTGVNQTLVNIRLGWAGPRDKELVMCSCGSVGPGNRTVGFFHCRQSKGAA